MATVCVWLPLKHTVAAQTIRVPQDSVIVLETDGDTADLENAQENAWLRSSRWRSSLSWQSDLAESAIGNAIGFQTRLRIEGEHDWSFGLVLDKDAGEPFGWRKSVPWAGPELKRVGLSKRTRHWQFVLGDLRIQHGFGIISGRRVRIAPPLSSALWQPEGPGSVREYAGTSGAPVRRGVALSSNSTRGRVTVWRTYAPATVSTRFREESPAKRSSVVVDASSTSAFRTGSSTERRHGLRLGSTGIMLDAGYPSLRMSALLEHLQSNVTARGQDGRLKTILPSSLLTGSVTTEITWKNVRFFQEFGRIRGRHPARWSIRWKHRGGSGLLIGRLRHPGAERSPFGSDQRFMASYRRESHWTVGIHLRWNEHRLTFSGQRLARHPGRDPFVAEGHVADGSRGTRMSVRYLYGTSGGHTLVLTAAVQLDSRDDQGHSAESSIGTVTRQFRLGIIHRVPLGKHRRWTWNGQLLAGGNRRVPARNAWSGLVAMDLQKRGPAWTWAGMMLVRGSRSRAPVLYARMPAPAGFFPVLAGSTSRTELVSRLAWNPSADTRLELWTRLGRSLSIPAGPSPRNAGRLVIQATVDL